MEENPYACGFCDSEFKRRQVYPRMAWIHVQLTCPHSDALRRHWKSCTARLSSGDLIPQRSRSGKKKHACDRCAERKRACNQGMPCAECEVHHRECTYTRTKRRKLPAEQAFTLGPDVPDPYAAHQGSELPPHQQNVSLGICQLRDQVGFSSRRQFNFLLKFTHATGINQGYNCNRSFMADTVSESILYSADGSDLPIHTMASNPWDFLLEEISLWPDGGKGPLSRFNSPARTDPGDDALSIQCGHIWNMFAPLCDSFTTGPVTMASVASFFSPEHVIHSLNTFWDRWYPHCPILHRPTFRAEECSPLLLANMVLMGGCTSSSQADRQIAISLLDVAENIVFSQPIFSTAATRLGMARGQNNSENLAADISILQATYLICIMQKWEGNDESKVRIQRDQFTRFVSVSIHACELGRLITN